MKKSIFALCAAAALGCGLTSCGSGEKSEAAADTLVAKEVSDSVCTAYGTMAGGYIGMELKQYAEQTNEPYDREEFVRGLEAFLNEDRSEAYLAGMSSGMRVRSDLKSMQEMGVQVDRELVMQVMKKYILADSVDTKVAQDAQNKYQEMMAEVSKQAHEREQARKANSPEAVKNRKSGEALINKLKAENPNLKVSDSGLAYVITKEGNGQKLENGQQIKVKYVGKHIDGKVFDSSDDANMMVGGQYVPGFTEALSLLTPGAAGTFYIPGKLAYGVDGAPQAEIGPDELLIFEVEILSVQGNE